MLIEHFLYSLSLALILGGIYFKFFHRDPSWLILIGAGFPDLDFFIQHGYQLLVGFYSPIVHGTFHTLIALVIFSLIAGFVCMKLRISFIEGSVFFGIGILSHFFEDSLVYQSGYQYLYPFSNHVLGWGIMNETENFFHIGATEVIIPGLIILGVIVCIRYMINSKWSFINYTFKVGKDIKYYAEVLLNIQMVEKI